MYFLVALVFFIICLGVFANARRKKIQLKYELTPNCLLTRWPLLFISGTRSLFYFSNYWNVYPEFLTEHGYEVYKLNLPWKGTHRLEKMREILRAHSAQGRRFHLVVDPPTLEEFRPLWDLSLPCILSISSLQPHETARSAIDPIQKIAFQLHRLQIWPKQAPDPHILGLSPAASLQNAQILLQKAVVLAEADHHHS